MKKLLPKRPAAPKSQTPQAGGRSKRPTQESGRDVSTPRSSRDGGRDTSAPRPSKEGRRDAPTPRPSRDGGRDASVPRSSKEGERDASAPRPSRDGGRDRSAPRSSREGGRDASKPRPSRDSDRNAAPRASKEGGRDASAPRPSRDGGRGTSAPRPSKDGERDASTPRLSRDGGREGSASRASKDGGRETSFREAPWPREGRRSHQTGREGLFINNWSALGEYLRAQPGALQKIFHAPREAKRIQELLTQHDVTLPCEEDQDMETGFAAQVVLHYKDEEQLLREAVDRTDDLIIACDHVTDTRNLGAIARTAAFFGISTLLMPKDRQAPITSATLGTAQGAFATVAPTEVTNLGRTLLALKDCGYWIAAADMEGMPVDKMPTRYEKLVLVLGSEDKGVSAQILNKSDFTLSIPSFGGKLESLNVSVAAGILIHALRAVSASGKILPQG